MQEIGNFGDPRAAWVHAGDDITPEPQPVKYKAHEVTTLHCLTPRKGQSHRMTLKATVMSSKLDQVIHCPDQVPEA